MNKTITALAILMASFAANASVLPETPVPFKSGTGAIDNDTVGNDSNLLIVFYVQIMPDDFVMQLHRF